MPHPTANELHRRRAQGVILGELEFCCEHAAFKGCPFGALNESLPVEHVILRHRASGDTLWRVRGQVLVLMEETFLGDGRGHAGECGRVQRRERDEGEGRWVLKDGGLPSWSRGGEGQIPQCCDEFGKHSRQESHQAPNIV